MKKLISVIIAASMLFTLLPAFYACNSENTLNLLNWGDYLDPELLSKFKRETGITVREKPVTSNEEMITLLEADDCPYDLCIPSDYAVERLIKNNKLAEINHDNIPNLANIDERFLDLSFDRGNKYSIPYTWGVLGVIYNKTLVDEADVGSWDLLWNEKYSGQIFMYDSVRDAMAAALIKCGYNINTDVKAEIDEAADQLIAMKPLVKAWLTDDVKNNMVSGGGAVALVYSGDAVWCMDPDEGNEDLEFYVPQEGSNIYFDNIVIHANSKKKDLAEKFINFLLDPENATANTEFIGYSSPNVKVADLIDDFFTNCTAYNIDEEAVKRCEIFYDLGDKIEMYNEAWDRVNISR